MKKEFCSALDKIHATDTLKLTTAYYLREKANKTPSKTPTPRRFKLAIACGSLLMFLVIGGFSYSFYFTSASYVDLDVNPSIGLTLNRFGKVINVQNHNLHGNEILENTSVRFKPYDEAMRILLAYIISTENLLKDGFISVTLQTNDSTVEEEILTLTNQLIDELLIEYQIEVNTEISPVPEDVRKRAHQHHLTPARYLAIMELLNIDSSISIESYLGYSLTDIREHIQRHHESYNSSERCSDGCHHFDSYNRCTRCLHRLQTERCRDECHHFDSYDRCTNCRHRLQTEKCRNECHHFDSYDRCTRCRHKLQTERCRNECHHFDSYDRCICCRHLCDRNRYRNRHGQGSDDSGSSGGHGDGGGSGSSGGHGDGGGSGSNR